MRRIAAVAIAAAAAALIYALASQPEPPAAPHVRAPACAGSQAAGLCWEGTVTAVIDGDTLDVDGSRIRLALIDAPELGERGYGAARGELARACTPGSRALVDVDDAQPQDRFGRAVAAVSCAAGGEFLNANEALLEGGTAGVFERFCAVSEFAASCADAPPPGARWAHDACC